MRRSALAAVLVLSLGAAACSDSDDSAGAASSGKEYADAVAASFLEDHEDTRLTEDDARCIGNGLVDAIGVDVFEEHGTPEELAARSDVLGEIELSEDRAEAVYDAIVGCVGVKDLFLLGAEDDSVSEKLADCMEENLDESLAKEFFVTMLQDEDPTQDAELMGELTAALTACMAL